MIGIPQVLEKNQHNHKMTSITIFEVIGIPCSLRLVLERISGRHIFVWLKLQFSENISTKSCFVLSDAQGTLWYSDGVRFIGGGKLPCFLKISKFAKFKNRFVLITWLYEPGLKTSVATSARESFNEK